MNSIDRIPDLDTFLAFSVALEEEAAERHDELADVLEVHNNPEVADTFRQLAHYSRLHATQVRALAADRTLPEIAPWEFQWETLEGPESIDGGKIHYLITTRQAIEIAMANEQSARDFYQALGEKGQTEEIRQTALAFAVEEQEHVDLLGQRLAALPAETDPRFDPDPPHMPE